MKKGESISMSVIIIAAIALLVLVVLAVLVLRTGKGVGDGTGCEGVGGVCQEDTSDSQGNPVKCSDGYSYDITKSKLTGGCTDARPNCCIRTTTQREE